MVKKYGGYMDNILRVNLTEGQLVDEPYPDEWKEKYLGGAGVAAKIIYDEVSPEVDPLSPENVMCIFTGPYTGTVAPLSGRYGVAAKSPLTGGWGESSVSGYWGPELKFSGYDGIVLTGRCDAPAYLWIDDGNAELRPADDLWGKTTGETDSILRERHGEKTKVLSIGPSGEKLVRFACVISDQGRAAGRCGLGAVMGSKMLKAIVVRGTKKIPTTDEHLGDLAKKYMKVIMDSNEYQFMQHGTGGGTGEVETWGDFPVKNWQLGNFPEAGRLSATGEDYTKYLKKGWNCYKCPIGCGRWIKVDKEIEGVQPFEGHGPEYETLGMFGGLLQNSDVEIVMAANHICNEYGLDTIATGSMAGFAFEAYDKGVLSKDDVGFDLKWGDGKAIIKLTKMIAQRQGIGDLLAEGPIRASKQIGKGSEEFAIHVKGMAVPAHDPRSYVGLAAEYAVSNRGACHLQGYIEMWQSLDHWAEFLGFDLDKDQFFGLDFRGLHVSEGKGELVAKAMSACNTLDALPVCKFMPLCDMVSGNEIAELHNAITGMNLTAQDLIEVGERMVTLKRAFNCRCGFSRADDKIPERLLKLTPDAPEKHGLPKIDLLINDFYEAMGWDLETGKPTKERLVHLSLSDVAEDLYS